MKLCLGTLCLNEMEWLPKLYEQHKDWPGLQRWIFVESADKVFAQTNPSLVSDKGLSTDGTTEFLEELCKKDDRIVHYKYGFCSNQDPAQGKCEARNRYLDSMEEVKPDFFIALDADEFYPRKYQDELSILLPRKEAAGTGFCFKHREIWYPPFIREPFPLLPQFSLEVTGGFWSIPYCRCWKWFPSLRYFNHNTPSRHNGFPLDARLKRFDHNPDSPYFVHMGFASQKENRIAKNRYYAARGEAVDRKRSWYVESRACFETWKPGDSLPRGAEVINYTGIIPECFNDVAC